MASGNLSVGGTCTIESFRPEDGAVTVATAGIAPVISLAVTCEAEGAAVAAGIGEVSGGAALKDCRPIGVGEVSEGIIGAG
jgi:hypothetical protein